VGVLPGQGELWVQGELWAQGGQKERGALPGLGGRWVEGDVLGWPPSHSLPTSLPHPPPTWHTHTSHCFNKLLISVPTVRKI